MRGSSKVNNSGGPLDNQTWQTEWKTALLATLQFWENKDQTLEAFVAAGQNFSLLATAHDCETGFLAISELPLASVSKRVQVRSLSYGN